MINWSKILFKDLSDLSGPQFFQKYILPVLVIFFSWGAVGHLYILTLNSNKLIANSGVVTGIAVRLEQEIKYKHYPLKINLTALPGEFQLPDEFKDRFYSLKKEIAVGDTVTLFTRNRWQTLLSWGEKNDIYEIRKDGRRLFKIEEVKDYTSGQGIIFGLLGTIFWLWYLYYKENLKKPTKKVSTIEDREFRTV